MSLNLYRSIWFAAFLCNACSTASPTPISESFNNIALPVISEKGRKDKNTDQHWWLNSGAYVYRTREGTTTVQGRLADNDSFRRMYAKSNPIDTDNGYRPQNILRLVTSTEFTNFTQQVFFNIKQINTSDSPNRNQSNGVLLFHRYLDGDNLYYVGIRVDGYAVIKKKLRGKYSTLQSVRVYPGQYNRDTSPNLLPINRRIGIKTVIANNTKGNVDIQMYMNDSQLGPGWTKVAQVEDDGLYASRLLSKGHAGIRSDFMDVAFDNYEAIELPK